MKKILILTSIGGGGQVTVNKALKQSLKNDYHVKSVLYFSHVLSVVDPLSIVTFGRYSGEDFYNYAQKKRMFRFMQGCYTASRWYYHFFKSFLSNKTTTYLQQEKPDLVISIIPIVNDIIASSCKKLNIPFLIIPPDLDVGFYTRDMKGPYNKNLYIALPFDNPMSRESLASAKIPKDQIFSIKYPLRHDFFENKEINSIKKSHSIIDNRPVVLLMMGAQGNHGSYIFAKELTKLKQPIHLLICIGRNEGIRKQLKSIQFPDHITPHVIGYVDHISDLMAIADLMISKAGILSITEGLHSNLPIIADQTEFVLSWELFHQVFLEKYDCGRILKNLDNLVPVVTELFNNPQSIQNIKNHIAQIKEIQNGLSITQVIERILS